MCHPGLPFPQGLSHPGSFSFDGFHNIKSAEFFLYSATSTLDPAIKSSSDLPDNCP